MRGGSAERRIGNKPRRISRIAGRQRHTATPLGVPPRRLKTLVRSSGDVATLGDFAPHACPRPAALAAETRSGPGRKPRASRVRACEARPRAPHPAGLGYPAPAKLSLCPTSGSPLEAPPHWTGREQDKGGFGSEHTYPTRFNVDERKFLRAPAEGSAQSSPRHSGAHPGMTACFVLRSG